MLIGSRSSKQASIAINNRGQVAIGFASSYEFSIHYTSGRISNDNNDTIELSDTTFTPPGSNFQPVVSINNHGYVLAAHHNLLGVLHLKLNFGIMRDDKVTGLPTIEWSQYKPRSFAANGYYASASINDNLDFVTAHKSLRIQFHRSIRNYVGHLSFQ